MRSLSLLLGVLAACTHGVEKDHKPSDGPVSIAAPLTTISTAAIDIEHGQALFSSQNCRVCHNITTEKKIGPGLKGVTKRRSMAWIQRMLLDPETMEREDPTARALAIAHPERRPEHGVEPTWMLPALLAYLTSLD